MPVSHASEGGIIFEIKYDLERNVYLIKDGSHGTGTFIKISPKRILRNMAAIWIGEVQFATLIPPVVSQGDERREASKP